MSKFFHDTATVFIREIRPDLQAPWSIVFIMGQPLLFLILFGSMLAGTGAELGSGATWQWFVPAF